jgi:CIC family chloride channel protein
MPLLVIKTQRTTLDTSSIIQTDYLTVTPGENLEKLVDLISHSNQVIFAVVDKDKRLVGVVHFNNIREIIFNTYRVKYTLVKISWQFLLK